MGKNFLFTSESVSEGHPDKIADQISDVIVDALLHEDPKARVACETMVKTGMVFIAGEITTHAWINIESLVRNTINTIGYVHSDMGFDGNSCAVINSIGQQSADISQGISAEAEESLGAGDQGMMFGYASNETPSYMPAPIFYAHQLMCTQAEVRKSGTLPWIRPDAKSQVTFCYENDVPVSIDTVVLSTQHAPEISLADLREGVIEEIIKPTLPKHFLTDHTKFLVNPAGRFVVGGPMGDCGLTGRKIIVDSYGGMARHGGGCFSGKDPSKVDRSGAYMARYMAKNIVKAGLADRIEIQISYAIGMSEPVSITFDCFNTHKVEEKVIYALIKKHFDLRPGKIIEKLKLLRPIYTNTAAYGHFGREEEGFTWEATDKAASLREEAFH